jgi:hypothetical protein
MDWGVAAPQSGLLKQLTDPEATPGFLSFVDLFLYGFHNYWLKRVFIQSPKLVLFFVKHNNFIRGG